MQVPEAPGRTFKVKVTRFVPNQEMVWRDGPPGLFLGVRTYSLTPSPDETATRFELTEVFSGLMLPMIAARLPDFGPIFERYAADLKAEARSNRPRIRSTEHQTRPWHQRVLESRWTS